MKQKPKRGSPEFEKWLIEDSRAFMEAMFELEAPEDDTYLCGPTKGEKFTPESMIAEDIAIDKLNQKSHLKVIQS